MPEIVVGCIIYPICATRRESHPGRQHPRLAAPGRHGTASVARGARLKLHYQAPSDSRTFRTVTGYGAGYLEVDRVRHLWNEWGAVLLAADAAPLRWDVAGPDLLTDAHMAPILAFDPEIVLFGTGSRQRFPDPAAFAPLAQAQVGFEIMDTAAACRTFNILVAEGRRVVAAFFPPDESWPASSAISSATPSAIPSETP